MFIMPNSRDGGEVDAAPGLVGGQQANHHDRAGAEEGRNRAVDVLLKQDHGVREDEQGNGKHGEGGVTQVQAERLRQGGVGGFGHGLSGG
ncbi:hypothetical protein LAJ19_15145 (plasmid) [Deinococcus taeanensis]|uniref:hypothetical protein n=1 Tax=Deinococcus taeanensis TaxID=2737050 RepID=UPI001CDC5C56|nr:hypothetical protein [Deinococcus taeanensis]UBV44142.1 hypothetical protein LAJ19_15145 [Deinococcus taeanensis]